MISAAAYVLKVPEDRREILLAHQPGGWFYSEERAVSEPVPHFEHSRRASLVIFACFEDDAMTHIAEGRKGASAGTRLVRLTAAGMTKEVRFEPVGGSINDGIDDAYRLKDASSPYLKPMISAHARDATVRVFMGASDSVGTGL